MPPARVPPPRGSSTLAPVRTLAWWPAWLVSLAGVAAYHNALRGEFLFDDIPAIVENPTIRQLWPPGGALSPPDNGSSVVSRPVVNLSLALNHALGGLNPVGYHAFNVVIHLLAGLLLLGIVRRTLLRPVLRERFGAAATMLASAVAVLWTVHPLQTESVTFVVQRTESLMGLFFLLTLYGFVRGVDEQQADRRARRRWFGLAIGACLLGMATKEVMVVAPVIVWLYDRTFVSGSFAQAWKERRWVHASLAATWLLLAALVIASGATRGDTGGFGGEVSWWQYLFTQCEAVIRYLGLSFWPHPLVADYGVRVVEGLWPVFPQALALLALGGLTLVALWRWPGWGFVGFWFFSILAPSSSVVPLITQTMAEHRMYLSLAAVVVAFVIGGFLLLGRRSLWLHGAIALVFTGLTIARNSVYATELDFWRNVVERCPENARGHNNLALELHPAGQVEEAITHFQEAVRLEPAYVDARFSLGVTLMQVGRAPEAVEHLEVAAELTPERADWRCNLANALALSGRVPEAMREYAAALAIDPESVFVRYNFGNALFQTDRNEEAIEQYRAVLARDPSHVPARFNLGVALLKLRRYTEAAEQFEAALELQPDWPAAQAMLERARAGAPPPFGSE